VWPDELSPFLSQFAGEAAAFDAAVAENVAHDDPPGADLSPGRGLLLRRFALMFAGAAVALSRDVEVYWTCCKRPPGEFRRRGE
jgi:hypothetical protein